MKYAVLHQYLEKSKKRLKILLTQNILMLLDDGVHDGLGEHRLIDLIVPKLPVPDQINNNILVPGCAPLRGNVRYKEDSLWVVCVHVENRSIDNPTYVGTVRGGSGVSRIGCESNLIVCNNMNSSLKIQKNITFIYPSKGSKNTNCFIFSE